MKGRLVHVDLENRWGRVRIENAGGTHSLLYLDLSADPPKLPENVTVVFNLSLGEIARNQERIDPASAFLDDPSVKDPSS